MVSSVLAVAMKMTLLKSTPPVGMSASHPYLPWSLRLTVDVMIVEGCAQRISINLHCNNKEAKRTVVLLRVEYLQHRRSWIAMEIVR